MSPNDVVNMTSLSLISDELVITIEQASSKLEQFVAEPHKQELLNACIQGFEQISGTLRLVQLYGADLLAGEILSVVKSIDVESAATERLNTILDTLTSAFFILPRYLEYVQQTSRGMPVLLIPYINEMRGLQTLAPISESHFFQVGESPAYCPAGQGTTISTEEFSALVRRLRHMYQVGLLNTLQGRQARSALGIMQRALERLEIISGDRPKTKLWWVGATALEVMRVNNMELTKGRKMLLAALDREIKKLQVKGSVVLDEPVAESFVKQLVYLVALAPNTTEKMDKVLSAFAVQSLPYNDSELRSELEALKGPSAHTVASVAAVLKDELRSTKEILENASQTSEVSAGDYDELIDTLAKVSDILAVVGLVSASSTLKEEISKIEGWRDREESADTKDLIEVADALLYIESSVSGLEGLNLSDEKLMQANSLARKDVIAFAQLAEAEILVVQEAASGLALVKRALNSFSESNYDRGHIKNVGATLNSIRGGMLVLGRKRAAAIVASCTDFIEETLLQRDQPAALQQLLETFADAVIGLEYYLDAIKADKNADTSVLDIAEESLQALGHQVNIS